MTLPATPPVIADRVEPLAVGRARRRRRPAPRRPPAGPAPAPRRGSRWRPATSARCARARRGSRTRTRSVPWQPPSTAPSVGSSRIARSPASTSGAVAGQPAEPVARRLDLLAVVEDPGEVDARVERAGADEVRHPQHHGDARTSCPSCRSRAARRRPAATGRCRRSARCRGGRPARRAARGRARCGRAPRCRRAPRAAPGSGQQRLLDEVGERAPRRRTPTRRRPGRAVSGGGVGGEIQHAANATRRRIGRRCCAGDARNRSQGSRRCVQGRGARERSAGSTTGAA